MFEGVKEGGKIDLILRLPEIISSSHEPLHGPFNAEKSSRRGDLRRLILTCFKAVNDIPAPQYFIQGLCEDCLDCIKYAFSAGRIHKKCSFPACFSGAELFFIDRDACKTLLYKKKERGGSAIEEERGIFE